jgi:hypothetical protein
MSISAALASKQNMCSSVFCNGMVHYSLAWGDRLSINEIPVMITMQCSFDNPAVRNHFLTEVKMISVLIS